MSHNYEISRCMMLICLCLSGLCGMAMAQDSTFPKEPFTNATIAVTVAGVSWRTDPGVL